MFFDEVTHSPSTMELRFLQNQFCREKCESGNMTKKILIQICKSSNQSHTQSQSPKKSHEELKALRGLRFLGGIFFCCIFMIKNNHSFHVLFRNLFSLYKKLSFSTSHFPQINLFRNKIVFFLCPTKIEELINPLSHNFIFCWSAF